MINDCQWCGFHFTREGYPAGICPECGCTNKEVIARDSAASPLPKMSSEINNAVYANATSDLCTYTGWHNPYKAHSDLCEKSFECITGYWFRKQIIFTVNTDEIKIKSSVSDVIIHKKDLLKIDFRNLQRLGFDKKDNKKEIMICDFKLIFVLIQDGEEVKYAYSLFFCDSQTVELIKTLTIYFPEANYLVPNEKQMHEIINRNRAHSYYLKFIRGFAWITAIYICFGVIALCFGFTMHNPAAFGLFVFITLLFLVPAFLLITKKLNAVRTDKHGVSYRKIIKNGFIKWDDFALGEIMIGEEKIPTNDDDTMIISYFLVVFQDIARHKEIILEFSLAAGWKLFLEFYYRNKMPYEQARDNGAFIMIL